MLTIDGVAVTTSLLGCLRVVWCRVYNCCVLSQWSCLWTETVRTLGCCNRCCGCFYNFIQDFRSARS